MSWNPWPSFFSIKILIQFQLERSKLIFSRDSSKPVENLQCGDLSATFGELILREPLFKAFLQAIYLAKVILYTLYSSIVVYTMYTQRKVSYCKQNSRAIAGKVASHTTIRSK